MARKVDHSLLLHAKKGKKDEFYTQLTDIENEISHYEGAFTGKVVYCNTDNPLLSNFVRFFYENFNALGLKKLIATSYAEEGESRGRLFTYTGDSKQLNENAVVLLDNDGDFRSEECVDLLKESDIVVTNPPFSLFRDFVMQMISYKKTILGYWKYKCYYL